MFGPLPIEPQELIQQLVTEVTSRVSGNWSSKENTTWTLAVKEALKLIATRHSKTAKCFYTRAEPGMREFLLDVVWWDNDAASFACECEWQFARFSNSEQYAIAVGEDFEKLLVFKAPLKLMIFASSDSEIQQNILEEIKRYYSGYQHHVDGEVYLILDFAPTPKVWIARVDRNGPSAPFAEEMPMSFN